MPIMPYAHINRADLNLLHTLFALLEERHVTRAARRCFLSQPAMSRALERLREMFGDELLIRAGHEYERTARGERLLRDLESLLPRLELLLKGDQFDPALSEERFRVTMTDHACAVLLPDLVRRVAGAAPKSRLEVVQWSDARFQNIEAGRLDLVLDVASAPSRVSIPRSCSRMFSPVSSQLATPFGRDGSLFISISSIPTWWLMSYPDNKHPWTIRSRFWDSRGELGLSCPIFCPRLSPWRKAT
jgi:DNA-binding transcriptional LysR family regulator